MGSFESLSWAGKSTFLECLGLVQKQPAISIMGSVGFLLADWSIELIRSKKRKAKAESKKKEKHQRGSSTQTEAVKCVYCSEQSIKISSQTESLKNFERERVHLLNLLGYHDNVNYVDVTKTIESKLRDMSALRSELEQLKEEDLKMATGVEKQLSERDRVHSEMIRSVEIATAEQERQMLQSSNLLRQQLAESRREVQLLQKQLSQLEIIKRNPAEGSLDKEMDSLRMVLDMKREETNQLKAANNSLMLEMERFSGLEVKLQVKMQKTEEMNAMINMKNEQLRQVLDEYDSVQQQLEVEVSAHMACQQELEKNQWDKDNFLPENEKRWKDVNNQKMSGMVLDVVQKEKALAYSFNY